MTVRPSSLAGVHYGRLVAHADERGSFREVWRGSVLGGGPPPGGPPPGGSPPGGSPPGGSPPGVGVDGRVRQANFSRSAAGVLRGLHYHRRQVDYWVVIGGRAFMALVDLRPLIAQPGAVVRVETRELQADDWVEIPEGVAHGFLALEALELLYLVSNEYDGTDELGFAWADPTANVAWPPAPSPDGRPILSERDQTNPPLVDLVDRLRG